MTSPPIPITRHRIPKNMDPPHKLRHRHRSLSPMILGKYQIYMGLSPPLFKLSFKTYGIMLKEAKIKLLWRLLNKHNISINYRKTARLPLRILWYKFLTDLFTNLGFKGTNLFQPKKSRLAKIALSLAGIAVEDGKCFEEKSKESKDKPQESRYDWKKEKTGSSDNNLWIAVIILSGKGYPYVQPPLTLKMFGNITAPQKYCTPNYQKDPGYVLKRSLNFHLE